jgi:hypothetical protein
VKDFTPDISGAGKHRVTVESTAKGSLVQVRILDADSEDLCRLHTHTPVGSADGLKRLAGDKKDEEYSSSGNALTKQFRGTGYGNRRSSSSTSTTKGACGLSNLGNTCFMNSMLQCLSHTEALTTYFLTNAHLTDINRSNPLGHGGRIASAYGDLVRDLWSGEYSVVTPGAFKTTVGEFAPQFSGYQQQDSQELMSCVLDGLHEDLNRVLSKPFVATVDSNGRADEVVSREAWSGHLMRNDSRVNDCCFGQMKSHLTCTGCGNTSVTFDPFSSLSLPVPVSTRRTLRLPLHLLTGAVRELVLSVDIAATIADVRAQIQAE